MGDVPAKSEATLISQKNHRVPTSEILQKLAAKSEVILKLPTLIPAVPSALPVQIYTGNWLLTSVHLKTERQP